MMRPATPDTVARKVPQPARNGQRLEQHDNRDQTKRVRGNPARPQIHLVGMGSMRVDFGGFSDRAFEATFPQREDGAVVSETGATGWSLLDTREPLWPVPSNDEG